ncbi:MAG: YitT family protein [Clostridia bacterium]|nr:YitT family protein [Clostridia bacterium]
MKASKVIMALLGAFIMAFGLYEIHSFSGVTEGGVLGLTLLLERHFSLSPAFTSLVMNIICYIIGWKTLGKGFLLYSGIATLSFSLSYRLLEMTQPIFTPLYPHPLACAVVGALFIGVGAGLCVRSGGAPSGDDALAMGFSKLFKLKIETVYLISDLTVLALSLSYIPIKSIMYSLLTVILSGKIVGIISRI